VDARERVDVGDYLLVLLNFPGRPNLGLASVASFGDEQLVRVDSTMPSDV
jgi:hypothetical protein